ncbi:MAG: hypothetical protein DWC00_02235 [Candidatus Poseidoniales archaeon]|nr:MAG: hypothetical protein DWC00_02235 [Candidatus Poseidoniales archaeon]
MVEIAMMEIAIGVGGIVLGFVLGRMTAYNGNSGNNVTHNTDNRNAIQGNEGNVQTSKGKQNN